MPRPVCARAASWERGRALLVFLALFFCYGYFYYRGGNWNVESRHAQIVALACDRSLAIDPYHQWTGDKAYYRGHYYSDKLLGPSLIAAPVFWGALHLLPARGDHPAFRVMLSLRIANLLTNALLSALLAALLYRFLAELGLTASLRAWVALSYGLGTLALPYSTALFGHQFGAFCSFYSFVLLWRLRRGWSSWRAVAAGILAGLGAMSDFTTLLLALFLLGYALRVALALAPRRQAWIRWLAFAAAALVAASPQFVANWLIFGGPFVFPHVHHVQPSFLARHTSGLLGVHLPRLFPLYQLTFGPWRGLFHGSPVLLLALPGFFLLGREWRAEAIFLACAWLGVLLMSAGYENWTAGSSYGPRYQIPAVPLLMIAVAAAAPRWPLLFRTLALLSMLFMLIITAQSPFVDENLRTPLASALIPFLRGELLHGNLGKLLGLPGLWSLVPLAAIELGLLGTLAALVRRAPAGP